jgi:hypothetical protein
MLIFIDESGDPGFKLNKGASPIFVAVMVIFEEDRYGALTQSAIEKSALVATTACSLSQVSGKQTRAVSGVLDAAF